MSMTTHCGAMGEAPLVMAATARCRPQPRGWASHSEWTWRDPSSWYMTLGGVAVL